MNSTSVRLSVLCAVLLLGSGCATRAMKGTPFYTGEWEQREGALENRQNAWPLYYYREPALSVLWPLFEKSPDHLALRPFYAVHGLEKNRPVHTVLWPLGRFDPGRDAYRFFPFFRDDDSFTIFPFYWHSGEPFAGNGLHSLWPLWIYSRRPVSTGHETILNLAWPLIRFERSPWENSSRIFPLFYSDEHPDGDSLFVSPLYFSMNSQPERIQGVPLLLSWRDRSPERDTVRVLWPLTRFSSGKEPQSSYVFPFWSHDPRSGRLLTPLYMKGGEGETRWYAVPPLFYREETDDTSMWVTLLGGVKREKDGGWLITPFYAEKRRGTEEQVTVVPPLLSWKQQKGDTSFLMLLAGLARVNLGPADGPSHVFPLWYSNPATESFFTPLWAGWRQETSTHRMLPLLMSAWKTDGKGAKQSTYFAGIGGYSRNAEGETHASHLLPFWAYRKDAHLLTPIVGRDAPGASGTFHYWFTPLVGGYRNDARGGWLFPLYHRKIENESGHGRTRFLWAMHRREPNHRHTSFFPFYSASQTRRPDPATDLHLKRSVWREEEDSTSFLLLFGRDREVLRAAEQRPFRIEGEAFTRRETEVDYAFPFWRSKDTVYGDNGPRLQENNILWRLYDSRRESSGGGDKPHDYVRRRILWRVWHYERLNEDVSVDAFPFITYDRKTDGFKRVSFLGRVFRHQTNADGGTTLHILFLPLRKTAPSDGRTQP